MKRCKTFVFISPKLCRRGHLVVTWNVVVPHLAPNYYLGSLESSQTFLWIEGPVVLHFAFMFSVGLSIDAAETDVDGRFRTGSDNVAVFQRCL